MTRYPRAIIIFFFCFVVIILNVPFRFVSFSKCFLFYFLVQFKVYLLKIKQYYRQNTYISTQRENCKRVQIKKKGDGIIKWKKYINKIKWNNNMCKYNCKTTREVNELIERREKGNKAKKERTEVKLTVVRKFIYRMVVRFSTNNNTHPYSRYRRTNKPFRYTFCMLVIFRKEKIWPRAIRIKWNNNG